MTGAGFLRATWLVLAKDLRVEWRTWETLSTSLVFSLTVLVVFNFAFGLDAVQELGVARLVPGVIWTVLAFAAVVGGARSAQLEREQDTLGALLLAPVDRSALYLGKLGANLFKLLVLEAVVVPLSAVFFNYDLLAVTLPMIGVLLLHSLGILELATLFSAIVVRVGRGEALVATLLFPAATPLFISAVKCTAALLDDGSLGATRNWVMLTVGFDVLYLALAMWAFEFVLEDG